MTGNILPRNVNDSGVESSAQGRESANVSPRLSIMESSRLLSLGLRHLSSLDSDRATRENSVGFNGTDSSFGNDIAYRDPETWSIRQYMAVHKMLRKYSRTQIGHIIADYSALYVANINDQSPRDIARAAKANVAANDSAIAATKANESSIYIGTDSYNRVAIICKFRYDSSIIESLRNVRAQYNPTLTARVKPFSIWTLPHIAAGAQSALTLISNGIFTADDQNLQALQTLAGFTVTPTVESTVADQYDAESLIIPGLASDITPYSFQNQGIAFMANNKRVILADDMGTGKTLQSLSAVAVLDSYPLLVVCPLVVKGNWLKEIRRFYPTKSVAYIGPDPEWNIKNSGTFTNQWKDSDIVVINYDIITRHCDAIMSRKWQAIICDESHYVKNRSAQRSASVIKIATGYDPTLRRNVTEGIPVRFLLTGTPIMNRPAELISQLTIIDRLRNPFGGYNAFMRRYCGAYNNGYGFVSGEAKNLEELASMLRTNILLRRTKREVLPFLPGKARTILTVPLSNRETYNRAESNVARFLSEMAYHDSSVIQTATLEANEYGLEGESFESYIRDAREMNARSAESRAKRAEILVAYNTLRQLAARGKIDSIIDWINDFQEQNPDEKLVVFAHHADVINTIASTYGAPKIVGGVSNTERTDIVERFQTDPQAKILVCSTRAGGVGITLTASNTVLVCELDWNPAALDQAEDRVNRIGQDSHCDIYYMLGDDSVDDDMYSIIDRKRGVIHAAIGDSDDDLIETSMMDAVANGILSRNS